MKKQIYFFVCILFLFFCCFLFMYQVKKINVVDQTSDFKNFSIRNYSIDNKLNHISCIRYFFDNFYIAANTISSTSVICKLNKQGKILEEITLELNGNFSILDFSMSEQKDIFCLITNNPWENLEYSAQNQTNFVEYVHFNSKGENISSTKLKFPQERKNHINDKGSIIENSYSAILSERILFLFDQDGNLSNQYNNINGENISLDFKGNLCILSNTGSECVLKQASFSSQKIEKEYKISLPIRGTYWMKAADKDSNYDVIFGSTEGIYGYSYQTRETILLLQWIDFNIVMANGNFIDFVCLENDSYAFLIDKPKEGIQLLIVEPQAKNENFYDKKELVLYTFGNVDTDRIKYGVTAWNQEQDDYKISIKDCLSFTQLSLDIVSEHGPDIIYLPELDMSWNHYIEKGYFADYNTLMEQRPEGLQKKDILDNVRNIYEETYDGLYFLPISFSVQILAGKKKDIPEKKQWTLKELNAVMEKIAPIKFIEDPFQFLTEKESLLQELFFHSIDDFYDTTYGLKVEHFKELLDFTMKWTLEENKQAEQSLLYSDVISPILTHSVLKNIETIYGKNNYQLIGYPCETGTGVSILEDGVFAIVANENSSIAWNFVQSFYSQEAQNDTINVTDEEHPYSICQGFPIRKDAFYEQFKRLKSPENYKGLLKRNSAAKKEIDMLKQYIECADRISYRYDFNNSLRDILSEEVAAYFNGNKTQEIILDVLKNRINLYNKEQEILIKKGDFEN